MKRILMLITVIMTSVTGFGQSNPKDSKLNLVKYNKKVNEYLVQYKSTFPIEIRINDIPVARQSGYLGVRRSLFINWAIPKSGLQVLTYTIDLGSYHSQADNLNKWRSRVGYEETPQVEITWYATCCGESPLDVPEDAVRYNLYFDELTESDVNRGFYTDTIVFDAKVGYDFSDWEKGVAFSEMDASSLKEKLYQKCQRIIQNIKEGNRNNLDIDWENALYENAASRNWKKDWAIEEQRKIYLAIPELLPIDSCELKMYGNGKLVSLISREQHIQVSALTCTMYHNIFGRDFTQYHNLYFYMPKGSDDLELIRYDFYSFQ